VFHGGSGERGSDALTFGAACEEWLRYVEQDRRRAPSTLADYRNTVRAYLRPERPATNGRSSTRTPVSRAGVPVESSGTSGSQTLAARVVRVVAWVLVSHPEGTSAMTASL
jgi:hypothetical protein